MPTTTTAAVLREGHGPFVIEELTVADPGPGEVAVHMTAAGMCHTDLLARELPPEFFAGPMVYGHEGAGVVTAVGPGVDHVAEGDAVVLSFNSCGACPSCAKQRLPYCENFSAHNTAGGRPDGTTAFTDADGAPVRSHYFGQSSFAADSVVSARSVVPVDPGAPLHLLGPLGCGVQTGAGAILNTLDVAAGESVVVAGAGALGLSAVMAARVAGAAEILVIDRHETRLELARRFGATGTITGPPDGFADQIRDATGHGADHAFDTTGNNEVAVALFRGLNNLGTLGIAGVGWADFAVPMREFLGGRTITGVMEGDSVPTSFIPRLIDLHASGRFPFDELITEFPLAEINAAEAASMDGSVIKPVLRFD